MWHQGEKELGFRQFHRLHHERQAHQGLGLGGLAVAGRPPEDDVGDEARSVPARRSARDRPSAASIRRELAGTADERLAWQIPSRPGASPMNITRARDCRRENKAGGGPFQGQASKVASAAAISAKLVRTRSHGAPSAEGRIRSGTARVGKASETNRGATAGRRRGRRRSASAGSGRAAPRRTSSAPIAISQRSMASAAAEPISVVGLIQVIVSIRPVCRRGAPSAL